MKTRIFISGMLAAAMVLTGGWLAGSYASGSGWKIWLRFTSGSANTPLCGQNQAYLSVGGSTVTWSATERSLDRSGQTCGALRNRPAGNMRITSQLLRDGELVSSDYGYNPNAYPSAGLGASANRGSGDCWVSIAIGAQYDSQNGGAWRYQVGDTRESACYT